MGVKPQNGCCMQFACAAFLAVISNAKIPSLLLRFLCRIRFCTKENSRSFVPSQIHNFLGQNFCLGSFLGFEIKV